MYISPNVIYCIVSILLFGAMTSVFLENFELPQQLLKQNESNGNDYFIFVKVTTSYD